MVKLLIIVLIVVFIVLWKMVKKVVPSPQKNVVYLPSSTPLQQPDNYKLKLLHYSVNISNTSLPSYGLFQKGKEYWLVSTQSLNDPISVRDLYPSFKGRPIGLVVFTGPKGDSFIIFSTDGKVYNPFSISHPWRRDYLYLPKDNPISIDGIPATSSQHGMFNSGDLSVGIIFRFYYSNYWIEEKVCVNSAQMDKGTSSTSAQACQNQRVDFPHPLFNVLSYYQNISTLYAVSSDGNIYSLQLNTPNANWSTKLSSGTLNWTMVFPGLTLPDPIPLQPSDKQKLQLFGADYDQGGIPIFIVRENNVYYLIDQSARKFDLRKTFQNLGVTLAGNIIDFTKAGEGEYDYLIAVTDGNLYGITASNIKRPMNDFINVYNTAFSTNYSYTDIKGFSSSNKWEPISTASGVFKYYLVFFLQDGSWFEVKYDIKSNTIQQLGQTDRSSGGKWTDWSHVKPALNSDFKMSTFGWSIFTSNPGSTSPTDNLVYSINNPPESWLQMLFCTKDDNGNIQTSSCAGLGDWKDYNFLASTGPVQINGRVVYEDYGPDTSINIPVQTIRKISLDSCIAQGSDYNAIVYNSNESDCYLYNNLQQINSFRDPTKATLVKPEYDASYRNRFCIKHNSTGKYMYWDFTDPDNQHIGLKDECISNVSSDFSNISKDDLTKLQQSLGSAWSNGQGSCLMNLNGVIGGNLTPQMSLSTGCNGGFGYSNGNFGDGTNCLLSDNNGNYSYGPCPGGPSWTIEDINCPSFTSTGYIYQFCKE